MRTTCDTRGGKAPFGANLGMVPSGAPSVRLKCRPISASNSARARSRPSAGQRGPLVSTDTADSRPARSASRMPAAEAMGQGVIVRAKRDGFVFGHCFNALRGGVSHGGARVYSPPARPLFFRRRAKRKRNLTKSSKAPHAPTPTPSREDILAFLWRAKKRRCASRQSGKSASAEDRGAPFGIKGADKIGRSWKRLLSESRADGRDREARQALTKLGALPPWRWSTSSVATPTAS